MKVTTLEATFGLDRKTIGSWGRAMLSRDPEVLHRVLLGRGASQKRTPAIDRYVVRRRSELLDEGCPEYRATLIREIESIFEVRLSGETIRQIISGTKDLEALARVDFEPPPDPSVAAIIPFLEETTCSPTAISTPGELPVIGRLRDSLAWSPERVLTFIVDRGIYSNDVFNQVLANPFIHLITWEKGYQSDQHPPWKTLAAEHARAGTHSAHVFSRRRNNSRDQRPYHFEYIHRPWAQNPAMRQIIVRATNPWGKTVQLSILTDDTTRSPESIVRLMFNRWIQENDFKYLDKHFGINQLTSYRSTPYEQLRGELTDRQVPSHAFLAKVKIGRNLSHRHARQLLAADRAQRDHAHRQQRLEELQAAIAGRASQPPAAAAATAGEKKELARLQNAAKRHEKHRLERAVKIESIHQQIRSNDGEKAALEKEVSRIDQLIDQKMVRMDLANKTHHGCAQNQRQKLVLPALRAVQSRLRQLP